MPFNALNGVGLIVRAAQSEQASGGFLGSCFAFRAPDYWVTAAHCIGDLEGNQLGVFSPTGMPLKVARRVIRHPTADIAILNVVRETAEGVEPFWGTAGNYGLGEDFFAFGYVG